MTPSSRNRPRPERPARHDEAGDRPPPDTVEIDDAADPEIRRAVVHALVAEERERADVADLLHVQPVQVLTAVGLRLGTLARTGGEAAELADELQDRIDDAIGQLRRIVRRLRTTELEDGVVPAMRRALDEVQHTFPNATTSLDVDRLDGLPSTAAATVCMRVVHGTMTILGGEHRPTHVSIRMAGAARTSCTITLHIDDAARVRAHLLSRLQEWFAVVTYLGGRWSVRAEGASVVVAFAVPADL